MAKTSTLKEAVAQATTEGKSLYCILAGNDELFLSAQSDEDLRDLIKKEYPTFKIPNLSIFRLVDCIT